MAITVTVNGTVHTLDVEPEMPVLWLLREQLGLTGTKYGCGIAACGACTVHLDGRAVRTCVLPASAADGKTITTIEGLASPQGLHAVQQAWIAQQVPQCGYCQSGMIMSGAAQMMQGHTAASEILGEMQNLCVCGTYQRIRTAVQSVGK